MISKFFCNTFAENGRFVNFMSQLAGEGKFSGAVLVAKNNEVIFENAYGEADKSRNQPNTINTKFNQGSGSKMFTAVAMMQLAEQGKFLLPPDMDDPFYPFLSKHTGRKDNEWFLGLIGKPAGGGYSTVRDMLKFSSALMSHALLSKESTELMITGKVSPSSGNKNKYAYGFMDGEINGHRAIGHNGGAPGIASDFIVFINEGYTIITFSNHDGGEQKPREPLEEIIRLMFEE